MCLAGEVLSALLQASTPDGASDGLHDRVGTVGLWMQNLDSFLEIRQTPLTIKASASKFLYGVGSKRKT
jgi:hypothetical protein